MPIIEIVFYVFSLITLAAAVGVIFTRNPVYAALCLVLTFFSAAAIWMLLEVEFLAIILVLVYVGAVMVLFLFVVMMLDINLSPLREGFIALFACGPALVAAGDGRRVADAVLWSAGTVWRGPEAPFRCPSPTRRTTTTPRRGGSGGSIPTSFWHFEVAGRCLARGHHCSRRPDAEPAKRRKPSVRILRSPGAASPGEERVAHRQDGSRNRDREVREQSC